MSHQQPRVVHGIVAMLDALGVRNATSEEAVAFINAFREMEENAPKSQVALLAVLPNSFGNLYKEEDFHTYSFGDTVLLVWEIQPTGVHLKALMVMGVVLSQMIIQGLDRGLRLRGAVSIGEMVRDGRSVLGPVITDVASWYDKADFIGVVATPKCGQHLSYMDTNRGEPLRSREGEDRLTWDWCFQNYDVPLQNNSTRKLWAVNWPHLIKALNKNRNPLDWYFDQTRQLSIPFGTEQKYDNTENFIAEMIRRGQSPK